VEEQTPATGAAPTDTVTDCRAEVWPLPEHWKVKVVFAVKGSVRPFPDSVPLLVQGPPAVQLVAFVEPQVRVTWAPEATESGEAKSEAVGAGLVSVQEAFAPPFAPWQVQVQALVPSTGFTLVPAVQEECVEAQTPFTGAAPTDTVTDCKGEVWPLPEHWKVKVVFAVKGSVRPLPASVPLLVQLPEGAVQLVAFVELQERSGRPL